MEIFGDALWDATKDTLIVLPVLYLAYLLVSYFSHNNNEKFTKVLHYTNKAGPAIGAFLGCIPQCGFSSVMSQLYSKKLVTLGTLIAVFISTSDEAVPIMISQPQFIPDLLILIAIKVVYAIIVGFIIDGICHLYSKRTIKTSILLQKNDKKSRFLKKNDKNDLSKVDLNKENDIIYSEAQSNIQSSNVEKGLDDADQMLLSAEDCAHSHSHKCNHASEQEGGHEHTHSHCCAKNIFLDALYHTAIIVAYVFAATLIINLISGYCGGLEPLQKFFTNNVFAQIAIASLIGLIPNCAASVFLVELFMAGVLYFPALVAGLTAGAGVGMIVLFTANYKKIGTNIAIVFLQYALAIIIGVITNFIPIW